MGLEEGRDWEEKGKEEEEEDFPLELAGLSLSSLKFFFSFVWLLSWSAQYCMYKLYIHSHTLYTV